MTVHHLNCATLRPVGSFGGRIGYSMPDPAAAALLTRERQLPFAVCAP